MVEKALKYMDWAVTAVEIIVSVGLVVMALGAAIELAIEIFHYATNGVALTTAEFNALIGTVLEVFIIVELFRIADAYMRHQNVIPTVLEAALVAVARKFVVFESAENYLYHALALTSLLLAVAISWWFLHRSHVCELHE